MRPGYFRDKCSDTNNTNLPFALKCTQMHGIPNFTKEKLLRRVVSHNCWQPKQVKFNDLGANGTTKQFGQYLSLGT